jgi:anaerobic selenocysteine-containing dehydrogenase
VEGGRAVQVAGDVEDPLYGGYTCVKGRSQPSYLSDPGRLLHSLKRVDQKFVPIPIGDAMNEIAEKLVAMREQYGPRAIAGYRGTMMVATNGADEIYHVDLPWNS